MAFIPPYQKGSVVGMTTRAIRAIRVTHLCVERSVGTMHL